MSRQESSVVSVIVVILLFGPILDNVLGAMNVNLLAEGSLLNRLSVVLTAVLCLPKVFEAAAYHWRRLRKVDVALLGYVVLHLIGTVGGIGIEDVSNLVRLLLCFYLVAYVLRRSRGVIRMSKAVVVGVAVYQLWLLLMLPALMQAGRLAYAAGGHANILARDLVALFILLVIITQMKEVFGRQLRRIAMIELVGIVLFLFLTGSRQGLILGVFASLAFRDLARGRIDLWRTVKRLVSAVAVALVGFAVLIVIVQYAGGEQSSRFLSLPFDENAERLVRYQVYGLYAYNNFGTLLFEGVNIAELFGDVERYEGVKLGAPHNMFLNVAVERGIAASVAYGVVHFFLIREVIPVHNASDGTWSSLFVAALGSIFLIAQVSNFMPQVSDPLAYFYYAVAGMYVNAVRDSEYQTGSGG